jgi:hypothetical protein
MPETDEAVAWVVYQVNIDGRTAGRNAVCEQREWDAMGPARPGCYTLVKSGITNEAEAERLARGTSGDAKVHLPRRS